MKPRIVMSMVLLMGLLVTGLVAAQEPTPLAPEELFAPGIEVLTVEIIPPYVPRYRTPTPVPTPAACCGFVSYQHFGETDDWFIDYAEAQIYAPNAEIVPLTLCNRHTGERRELQVGEYVEGISTSPSGRYAVIVGGMHFFGYDFEQDEVVVLGEGLGYDNQWVNWYGDITVLIDESNQPDSSVWAQVSLAQVDQAGSLMHLASLLKLREVPWFAFYQNPRRVAWIEHTAEGCNLNWIIESTGARDSFDISDICVVGMPLSDDPVGDYLFMPIRFRVVRDEPYRTVEAVSRDLIRVNLVTGERDVWYSGELERLNDLDPAQRYATLILDENGCIDLINEDLSVAYNNNCLWRTEIANHEAPEFEVALLDTYTHEIIYRRTAGNYWEERDRRVFDIMSGQVRRIGYSSSDPDASPGGDLFSLDDGLFVLFLKEPSSTAYPGLARDTGSDVVLSIDAENNVVESPLPGQLLLAGQDNAYLVLLNTDRDVPDTPYLSEGDLLLSDLEGNATLLLPDVVSGDQLEWGTDTRYRVSVERGEMPDQLRVSLSSLDGQGSAVYTVRIPSNTD